MLNVAASLGMRTKVLTRFVEMCIRDSYNSVKMAYEKIVNGTEPEFINDSGCYLIYPDDVDQYAADNGIDLG